MRGIAITTIAALTLAGCANNVPANVETFAAPSGQQAHTAHCVGNNRSEKCFNVAGETCHGAYQVLESINYTSELTLRFQCGKSDGKLAPEAKTPQVVVNSRPANTITNCFAYSRDGVMCNQW